MVSTPTTGTSGNSYATVTEADSYLDDSIRAGLTWATVAPEDKKRALISATRLLDKQQWKGSKADSANTLEWPRISVVDGDGNAVGESTVPSGIVNGCIELAYELTQNATLETTKNTGSNDKKLVAGSVEIEFFRPGGVEGTDGITRFPIVVMEYIREYLEGYGTNGKPIANGTGQASHFDDCDTYEFTEPF